MKKCAWILAFIGLLSLIGCGKDATAVFQGKIIEMNDEAMLVEPLSDYREAGYSERINVPIQYMPSSPEPTVGDVIEVTYNGIMQEERPPWPCGITKVVIVEHAVSEIGDNAVVNGDVTPSP